MTSGNDLVELEDDRSRYKNKMARTNYARAPTTRPTRIRKRQGGTAGFVTELKPKGDGFYDVFYTAQILLGPNADAYDVLVDTGSSDLWIASTDCDSCRDAPAIWDPTRSSTAERATTAGDFNMNYLRGAVAGPVYWEQLTIGGYTILHQAMAAATSVSSEKLSLGYSGILGLSLPPISTIASLIPASADSSQDGSPFSSNLFGLPDNTGPSDHYFAVSLSRPGFEDRTRSKNSYPGRLGIGEHVDEVVAASGLSEDDFENGIDWMSMVSAPTGFGHWKTRLSGFTVWKDGAPINVRLGRSVSDGGAFPIAIFDTGGANMLASKTLCDAIYSQWDISASAQGIYYVPCRTPLNVTFTFGQTDIPIHPIDMSTYENNDPASAVCQGTLQASDGFASIGDLALGVSFLRNVYMVHSYGDRSSSNTFGSGEDGNAVSPQIGIVALTDISLALTEFENIRVKGMGPDGQPFSGRTQVDESERERTIGVAGKIALGVGIFIGVCVLLFGARWIVLNRRFKRRNMNMSEEGVPMTEWSHDRKDPSNVSEFGLVGGIEGDLASKHGTIKSHGPSTKRQSSGPWAGFSLLTFIGARRLGFGGGYQRTENPGADVRRARTRHMPSEDELRQQRFEEYQRRNRERPEYRRNETSVWSDMTWVDMGNGALAPKDGLSTPNDTVVGSTTNLNTYGFPKGMSVDDMIGRHGEYDEFGGRDSSDESTERGSTLRGSVHNLPPAASTSMGRRSRSGSGSRSVGSRSRSGSQERIALLDSNRSPEPLSRPPHRSSSSFDSTRSLGNVNTPPNQPPTPPESANEPPSVTQITLMAPFPHRQRLAIAVEPSLSPLTEVNSSEFLSSPRASNNSANLAAVAAGNRMSLGSLANSLPSIGEIANGLARRSEEGGDRSSLERSTSIGALSVESEVLVPLPISIRRAPEPQPIASSYNSSPLASAVVIAPPLQATQMAVAPFPPPHLTTDRPQAVLPPIPSPPRSGTAPSRSQNPFDLLELDNIRGGDSRFPAFSAEPPIPRVDDAERTPRSPPASLPRSQPSEPRTAGATSSSTQAVKPRSTSDGSTSLPALQQDSPVDIDTDFGPQHERRSLQQSSLPVVRSDRPRMTGPRSSDPSASVGVRARGPRPMTGPRTSSGRTSSSTSHTSPQRASAASSPTAVSTTSRHDTTYESPVSFNPYSAYSPPPPSLGLASSSSGPDSSLPRSPLATLPHGAQPVTPPSPRRPSISSGPPVLPPIPSAAFTPTTPSSTSPPAISSSDVSASAANTSGNWRNDAARTAGVAGVGARSRFTGDSLDFNIPPKQS